MKRKDLDYGRMVYWPGICLRPGQEGLMVRSGVIYNIDKFNMAKIEQPDESTFRRSVKGLHASRESAEKALKRMERRITQ